MAFRGRGRKVSQKSKESYQQNVFHRGMFMRQQDPSPRDDCFEDNTYETAGFLYRPGVSSLKYFLR